MEHVIQGAIFGSCLIPIYIFDIISILLKSWTVGNRYFPLYKALGKLLFLLPQFSPAVTCSTVTSVLSVSQWSIFFSCDNREKVRGFLNHSTKVCLQLYLLSLQTKSAAPLGMMQHGTCGFGGREPYHVFAKTNGIITPICYIEAGPTSTCLKHCMLLTLTWVMIKLLFGLPST